MLSNKFARTVTAECFQSLLQLIQWSWKAFKAGQVELLEVDPSCETSAAISLDLERLIFICRACLR